ncbi:helix-turn-helix transcriptional regulator [Yersinia bercovieri]|uniref:LuxR family transcriptional regulator n=2 Tax=Yersinia bercovieri TaxID=634 RepID=A0A2G4U777_YERBE|nr:LuxR family transcriptional regulator [Yersinia bercovieri]EEQ08143.1 Transcriptional activator protein echR [Yersinia bercovieri ATCC 43970]PHZ29090.1 LuxR family transcriptional regulator [Yersinia bercovieri]QKJ06203.1 LuxR family transcriptional regulator [Yersinia bercovieri ATCC 43970]
MTKLFFNNELINTTVKKKLERKLEKYNNVKYAYAIMNKRNPADFMVISNRSKWFEFYTKNNFQYIDPIIITASHRVTPFSWDENIMINSGLKLPKIFDVAKEYDVINGHTFVLHDQYYNLTILSLMTDKDCDEDIEDKIANDKANIQMLLMLIHEKLTSFYNDLNRSSDFCKMGRNEIFTKRENEIIYWASVGKSYPEIALILGIKPTTVKHHMGKVVRKLGVTNAKHAISLAVELQLIRPDYS